MRLTTEMTAFDFMDASPFAHIAYTLDYTVLAVNRQHISMTGKAREDVVGRNLFDVFPPNPEDPSSDARVATQASLDRMVETKGPDDMETFKHDILRADGSFEERFWQITHSPIWSGPDGTGEIAGALQTTRDVTEQTVRRRLEDAQRRAAMTGGELMFFELDLVSGSLNRSPQLDELFGFAPGQAGDNVQTFIDRIIPGDRNIVERQLDDARSKPPHTFIRLDYRVIRPSRETSWVTARTETIGGMPNGGSARLTGVVLDVTDLRRSEAELRDTLKARDDLIAQKEILLNEVHHRIKNSLQIVCSILSLDARMADVEAVQKRLHRAVARVMAVASVHELIYKAGQVTTVDLEDYLVDLCQSLEASGPAAVLCHAEPLRLSTDKAISVALLINELVSNAFKHAFAGRADGRVKVKCVREGDTFVLSVSDDGSGKTHGSMPGLGTTVIAAMVAQLSGTITEGVPTEGSKSGLETLIRAPIED